MSVYPQIPIDEKVFRVTTLLCGHDTSHDIFQTPPKKPWLGISSSGGIEGGNPYKTANRNPLTTLKHNTFNFKSQTPQKRNSLKPRQLGRKTRRSDGKGKRKDVLKRQLLQDVIEGNVSVADTRDLKERYKSIQYSEYILDELNEQLNLYDFLYKNYKLQATEQQGPRLEDQSWISDPSEEQPEPMDMEGGQVGAGQVGAGPREKRQRKLSRAAQEAETRAVAAAQELWEEIRKWDQSVANYLSDLEWRNQMNQSMLNAGVGLQTYSEFVSRIPNINDDGSQARFIDLQKSDSRSHRAFRLFKKQYGTLNVAPYVKREWKRRAQGDTSNEIYKTWLEKEYKRSDPILSNKQKANLSMLHQKIMQYWCDLAYPGANGVCPAELTGWEKTLYTNMWSGNPGDADTKLFKAFSKDTRGVAKNNLGSLASVTEQAYTKGNVVNNAAPLHVYDGSKDPKQKLFKSRNQYHCVMVSVIDPQSTCPEHTGGQKGKPNGTLIISAPNNQKIQIKYETTVAKPYISFTIQVNNRTFTHKLALDKQRYCKTLRISEVIRTLLVLIEKEGLNLDTLDKISDKTVEAIAQRATGKLCGDFSQELFSVAMILSGKPIVFASNDRPSAIRFIYLIESLRQGSPLIQGLPKISFWGGYVAIKNNLIVADTSTMNAKAKAKRKKSKRRKRRKRKTRRR
tara:strand:- start:823 stop:2868 length:2046 start_codon:yes stop_codon:yes gene_type:complete